MVKKLKYTQLKNFLKNDFLNQIENFENFEDAIGQEKAVESLKFALSIKNKGYNIYISGQSGTGKATFAKKYAEDIAKTEKTPDDILYVYNFENPVCPQILKLPAGKGKEFKQDIEEFIHLINIQITKEYNSKHFEDEKEKIIQNFEDEKEKIIQKIYQIAKEKNFSAKISNGSLYFLPIIDGITISEEKYEELLEEDKIEIEKKSKNLEECAFKFMKKIQKIEETLKKQIENLEYNLVLFTVGRYLDKIQNKYLSNIEISKYLINLKEDILENMKNFLKYQNDEEDIINILEISNKKNNENYLKKYEVNLFIDNSNLKGAPVIFSHNNNYTNLIGEIEFENELGNYTTDFMKIKPGILHKANGGYLIIEIEDILKNPYSLETLFRILKTGELSIETLKEINIGGLSISTIKPQSLSINLKIILIGSDYYYNFLLEYFEDFKKLFKMHTIFDYEMNDSLKNIQKTINFILKFQKSQNLLPFENSAIKKIIEYSYKLAGRQDKLTTNFNKLTEILIEANNWAIIDNCKSINQNYIKKAIAKKNKFLSIYEQKINDMIFQDDIMIKTKGLAIGEINALSILDYGDYIFGKPNKITCTTYVGNAGLVNIEKESSLSGSIHDKGIQVITGYLGYKYAFEFPLSFSCRICFEQNYNGIDGDSASSAELYTVISSLSEIPINQGIAVTGSVNQKGEIQAIGGVNQKIEGFFDICNKRKLTGKQGVIIPYQNAKELMLKDEIIKAVKDNKFHIYPIKTIDEGLEILTGKKSGELLKNNKYPKDSIHFKVIQKLKYFYQKSNKK